MSEVQKTELELREDKLKLAEITGTPRNIEINERSLEAYRKAYSEKGQQIEIDDYSSEEFYLVKTQKKFDSIVDTEQPIIKKIEAMVRQPVTVDGKTKDALYYHGYYLGSSKIGDDLGAEFHEGWFIRPRLKFTMKNTGITKQDYDEATGERRGEWKAIPGANIYEHYIFLPENKVDRVKFLNDLLAKYPGTTPESIAFGGHLSYRQASPDNSHHGTHGGGFSWKMFTELSLRELGEVQQTGYYEEEKTGLKKDVKGRRVKYNDNTGKMEAIK